MQFFFVKPIYNFCKMLIWCKILAVKFHNFHSTEYGKCGNLLSRNFGKNFVKVTLLLKKLLKSWFDEIFFGETKFFVFPHFFGKNFVKATVFLNKPLKSWFDEIFFQWDQIFHFSTVHCVSQCGKMRNSLPRKFFSSNQFTAKFCSKTLISRKIRTEHFCSLKKSWSVSNFFSDDLESCNRRKFRESTYFIEFRFWG